MRSEVFGFDLDRKIEPEKPYEVINGVAVVPIKGILVHDYEWFWGETTYSSIAEIATMALADPGVKALALHIDSPGGEVDGCFELSDTLFSMRGPKPIWAILDSCAYSAAYALASAADFITVPRTGGSGSIGVITMHTDITGMLEQAGVKITTIKFGERKADGQPTTPLSKGAHERMQSDVDILGEMFVALVERNRRGLSADHVRKTEAGCFLGKAGVETGLVDAVMAPEEAMKLMMAKIKRKEQRK